MISYHKGDLLESGCEIIAHQVNLQDVMGGGLAKQIAPKYISIEKLYKEVCKQMKYLLGHSILRLQGSRRFKNTNDKVFIANCFTQNEDFTTNYIALKQCFEELKEWCKSTTYKIIGVPKNYGCGIAKGDWLKVEQIFKEIFESDEKVELQIWEFNS